MLKKIKKRGLQGFSQKAFVFNKQGRFLAIRRTKTAPHGPLKWDVPGGEVEFGEDPYKSMAREIKEEAGLIAKDLRVFDVHGHVNAYGDHWITIAYTAKVSKGKLTISWEHDLYKWLTLDEFLKMNILMKLRKFAKTLKYIYG